jgi:hypothetical protein
MSSNTTNDDVRTHRAEIFVEYGHLEPIISWCTDNCHSDWFFSGHPDWKINSQKWVFDFDAEQDYLLFVLTWK